MQIMNEQLLKVLASQRVHKHACNQFTRRIALNIPIFSFRFSLGIIIILSLPFLVFVALEKQAEPSRYKLRIMFINLQREALYPHENLQIGKMSRICKRSSIIAHSAVLFDFGFS